MNNIEKRILQKVDELDDYLTSTLQELVKIPSINHPPTGEEFECQMAVAKHIRELGINPKVYNLDDVPGLKEHPSYWPGRDYTNRPNIYAKRRGTGGGKSIVLSGHIDTVPLGTKEWKYDPFGAEIVDGRLYGLGSYDMKAGTVINLGVLRTLHELGIELKGDVNLETVVDEEFGGVNGTIAGRLQGKNENAIVITEPTDLMICNGNRGGQVAHITLQGPEGIIFEKGEPGHVIRKLQHFLKWIDKFRERRRAKIPEWKPGPLDPIPVLITKISSGGWGTNVPITVPPDAKVELYWQLVPGEEKEQVRRELFDLLDEMVADKPNDFTSIPKVEFPIRFMPASEIPENSPLVIELNKQAKKVTGHLLHVEPIPSPSDLYVVQRDFNLPAIHFGVRGGNAHAADEFIILEDLITATKIMTLFVINWCGITN